MGREEGGGFIFKNKEIKKIIINKNVLSLYIFEN